MDQRQVLVQTDIVDSTLALERLGDAAMSAVWRTHDRFSRDLLVAWNGREIDKSDGFLLLFDAVSNAVRYVRAYHRELAKLEFPLKARAGIHVGHLILRENAAHDVARGAKPVEADGLAKPVASRVMALAQAGQTLLTAEAVAAASPAIPELRKHGCWRFHGVQEPVELYGLADEAEHVTLEDTPKAYAVVRLGDLWVPRRQMGHSLPSERDSFVGRVKPLLDLKNHFDSGHRLVSIVGMGGTGKTRLAQRFGWNWLGDYPGGIWFADLSPARSLDGMAHAVAEGLGVTLGKSDPVDQLGHAIGSRGHCLLILDNFEQLTRLAEDTLGTWISRAPQLCVVVTSRERLGIKGEVTLLLEPLSTNEAVRLFERRAAAVGFQPATAEDGLGAAVESLVRLLDGLPLAIELAAARVSVMSPRLILERMRERFKLLSSRSGRIGRQATLRAAFDWSWDLLSVAEKAALAQLSVFEGGLTLAAAEDVLDLGADPGAPWPMDVMQSLLDKSLIRRRTETRFDLLSSVQDYAAEHLVTEGRFPGSGPGALHDAVEKHYRYFSSLGPAGAVSDLCADLDNLVTACRRATRNGDVAAAVGSLEGAWAALRLRGPFKVAVELAADVRSISGLPADAHCRISHVLGRALQACGRIAEATEAAKEALRAARSAGDVVTEGYALCHLGDTHVNEGRIDLGKADLQAALDAALASKNRLLECAARNGLGQLFEHVGDFGRARSQYEATLAAARAAGDRRWEGGSLGNLGLLLVNEGDAAEAFAYFHAALAIARELGDRQWEGNTRCNLGMLHHLEDQIDEARGQLESALTIAREIGHLRLECISLCNLGIIHDSLQEVETAQSRYASALPLARELADKRTEGQILNYQGILYARQGEIDTSRGCLDRAEALLVAASDEFTLGLLFCSRAECEHLAGLPDAADGALRRAVEIATSVGAKPPSELSRSIDRVSRLVQQ